MRSAEFLCDGAVCAGSGEGGAEALGFTRGTTPCGTTTLHDLFVELDLEAFEGALRHWRDARAMEGWKVVSLDGKRLRGTQGHPLPGVHILAAYAHKVEAVLKPMGVDAKSHEPKAAWVAIRALPLEGKIVTGDAIFCQRDLLKEMVKRKGAQYSLGRRISRNF